MSMRQHNEELLGAYVLGALDESEVRQVDEHLTSCLECQREVAEMREMEQTLLEVPPEAFIDGPPEGGDLLLQRTLRQVRAERSSAQFRRTTAIGVAVAASTAVVFFGGYLASGGNSSTVQADRPAGITSTTRPGTPPPGLMVASATDAKTKARMTVRVTPSSDWVRLNAAVTGIPAGERCRLLVVTKSGTREIAGSWVVGSTATGAGKGADIDGSAAVKAGDVRSVVVETESGKKYVSVPL